MYIVHRLVDNIRLKHIELVLANYHFSILISIALFVCTLLIFRVFLKYSFLNTKILICWILASLITLIYLVNEDDNSIILTLNSQLILMIVSFLILFIFFIFGLFFKKPRKRIKKYGKNSWWVNILSFVVTLAFCIAFNIILYISCVVFYI